MAKKAKPAKLTYVTLILDETGSMEGIRDDTIGGYNAYIDGLKEQAKNGMDFSFSLVKFDSQAINKVHVGWPIGEVPKLTRDTYVPRAGTPLVDACVKGILATAEVAKRGCPVVFVIQTDGYENASTEYTFKELAKLIKEKDKAGWHFIYLGAGIDAYETAAVMGIGRGSTSSYGRGLTGQAFMNVAAATSNVAQTGGARGSATYSAEMKATQGDVFDPDIVKKTTTVSKSVERRRKATGFTLKQ